MFHRWKQIVEMNDFDQLYHHQDENDINISHYLVMVVMKDIQIHLNRKLKFDKYN
jgi:hypothetical protein